MRVCKELNFWKCPHHRTGELIEEMTDFESGYLEWERGDKPGLFDGLKFTLDRGPEFVESEPINPERDSPEYVQFRHIYVDKLAGKYFVLSDRDDHSTYGPESVFYKNLEVLWTLGEDEEE
jgi:hypothetical protein